MRYYRKLGLLVLALMLGLATEASAQIGTCEPALSEVFLDINNVRASIYNNGNLFWRGGAHVYEVPKGGGANAIFTGGIWVGGTIDGSLRVAAARYGNYNFWAGPLGDNGEPPADCGVYDHIYKVSRNDIADYEESGIATTDLRTWPTGLGAPTLDADGNVIPFDITVPLAQRKDRIVDLAAGERPAILGDQSLWWVMNDRGNEHRASSSDTPPIGLEVHTMAFAFNTAGDIGNTTFYKHNMFYKGNAPLENAYIGIFSDPDLGNFDDDWVGSDTTLGMGFVYNSDNDDEGAGGYGSPAPAAGYDFFQGPIVPSPGDTANVSGTPVPDFKNLKMTSFVFYNNGGGVTEDPANGSDYYNYMQGRWKDGKKITFGGNGRDFSDEPTDFMYPGDPVTCEYWTECDSDGAGTSIAAADRRFVMSTGPFTINPGDQQEIVYGLVWARGEDYLDSVAKLRQADALAQAAFDVNFELPSPPDAPIVTATPLDGSVVLQWENPTRSNNYLDGYEARDPFAPDEQPNYVFEGYKIWQYDNPQDQIGKLIATFDVVNGVTRVIDGPPGEPSTVTASGSDSGVQHYISVGGLNNYVEYHFAVQPYAYNEPSFPKVYDGPISLGVNRVIVQPHRVDAVDGGTLLSDDAVLAAAGVTTVTGDCSGFDVTFDLCADKGDSVGGGLGYAKVYNPALMTGNTYQVQFYEVCSEGASARATELEVDEDEAARVADLVIDGEAAKSEATCGTTYDIIDTTTGEKKFDGTVAFQTTGEVAPQRENAVIIDGMSFSVSGPPKLFLGIDERAEPGVGGAEVIDGNLVRSLNSSAKRAAGDVSWYIHGNGGDNVSNSLGRIDWRGHIAEKTPVEYELRFVENPEVNGQVVISAWSDTATPGPQGNWLMNGWIEGTDRLFDDADLNFTPVLKGAGATPRLPMQLWKWDPITDTWTQVLYGILDDNDDFVWDMQQDAPFGSHLGYERIYATDYPYNEAEVLANGGNDVIDPVFWGHCWDACHVLGRVVFGPYIDQYRTEGQTGLDFYAPPSPGTTVRFTTTKPNLPGDVFTFNTSGLGATKGDANTAKAALENIGISPNPYKGASAYETSQLIDEVRFTNMPDKAMIRIFTLNGTLIRVMEKNSPGQASFPWDLTTEEGLPIASGMYLIHVEVPNVGEKVLKFAAIKKRIQLNTF